MCSGTKITKTQSKKVLFVRIVLVEDDPVQAELIVNWLTSEGHECQSFGEGGAFMAAFVPNQTELVILDWELPDRSGIELLRWLRKDQNWRRSILFITSRDTEQDIVHALNQGADDYMAKPVAREITLARVVALARRAGEHEAPSSQEIGPYHIDLRARAITRAGEPVSLSEREFNLAVLFLHNIGKLLSRDYLMTKIWGHGADIATRTLDTHLSQLRKKLSWAPEHGWRLRAVYQHGYRLESLGNHLVGERTG